MSEPSHLRVESRDGAAIVRFLDSKLFAELTITTLGDELHAIAERPDCGKLVLNFSGVEAVASAMLGKLIAINRKMRNKGGTMVMCDICENLRTILQMTKLDNILQICEIEADALAI